MSGGHHATWPVCGSSIGPRSTRLISVPRIRSKFWGGEHQACSYMSWTCTQGMGATQPKCPLGIVFYHHALCEIRWEMSTQRQADQRSEQHVGASGERVMGEQGLGHGRADRGGRQGSGEARGSRALHVRMAGRQRGACAGSMEVLSSFLLSLGDPGGVSALR